MPFMMIFAYLVYQDLRSLKGDVGFVSSSGEKFKWIGVGTLGYVVAPLILIGMLGTTFLASFFLMKSLLSTTDQEMTILFQPPDFPLFKPGEPPYPDKPGDIPSQPPGSGTQGFQTMPSQTEEGPHDIMVYIYSINYKGSVRLNGEELYEIKGEQDMNYNFSGSGKFRYGTNTIDADARTAHLADCTAHVLIPGPSVPVHHNPAFALFSIPGTAIEMVGGETFRAADLYIIDETHVQGRPADLKGAP